MKCMVLLEVQLIGEEKNINCIVQLSVVKVYLKYKRVVKYDNLANGEKTIKFYIK